MFGNFVPRAVDVDSGNEIGCLANHRACAGLMLAEVSFFLYDFYKYKFKSFFWKTGALLLSIFMITAFNDFSII